MIKLNSKNITYIALADSNNSLKAPKEIWYADSNNSVKLVYRRKDALIEGEDYEKYHWLDGRNGAYINTEYYPHTYDDAFYCHYKWDGSLRNPENKLLGVFGSYGYGDGNIIRVGINNKHYINYFKLQNGWDTLNVVPPYDITLYLSCYDTKYKAIVNGVTNEWDNNNMAYQVQNRELVLFENIPNNGTYFNGDIASFRVSDPTFTTDKLNLIPCKLLKPVPKWLDANGIRRQVGECGMIDLVSGKFYGNVNSVGTFTVENYYERKVWLQAEISGVNTLMSLPIYSNKMQYTRVFVKFANIGYFLTTNNISYINISGVNIIYNNLTHTATSCGNSSLLSYIEVVCDSDSIVIDGELLENNLPVQMIQFYNASTTVDANFLTSKVTVDNKERYIPCTLTMDLPASMDANNTPRTKGTSGMWDLVSDRFYGNVASSGTFKAVNLAEGVDYKVHQWLHFINDGTSSTTFMSLPVNSDTFSFKREIVQYANSAILITGNNRYSYGNSNSGQLLRIWDYTESISVYSVSVSTETPMREFKSTSDLLLVNEVEIPKYGFTINSVVWKCNAGYSCKNSSITVDGVERYVPVKLLRSLPSKYDANGIARQAGECGMYDTVNDVFYGNVASSGSFTVSDDN